MIWRSPACAPATGRSSRRAAAASPFPSSHRVRCGADTRTCRCIGARTGSSVLPAIAAAGNDENAALARVREAARGLGYAIVGFAAGPAPGVVLHAAAEIAPSAARLAAIDTLFGVAAGGCGVLRYDDARSSVARAARVDGARLTAAALTGDVRSHRWLCEMLTAGTEVGRLGHALLRGGDAPPIALAERHRRRSDPA